MADDIADARLGGQRGVVGDVDGEATAIGGRSGREARLDLLLAEELANDLDFLRAFVACIDRSRVELPEGQPTGATVRMNVDECGPDVAPTCHGETDIEVLAAWPHRDVPILVEDKLWAPFQALQAERYAMRAASRKGAAVLVAPRAFLDSHSEEAKKFHGSFKVEDIIDWLHGQTRPSEAKRRRWRATLLSELIERPPRGAAIDDQATMEFTAFCVEWFRNAQAPVEPSERSLHSAGQGWLWFRSPRGLAYKASGWARTDRAAVDLYLGDYGFTGDLASLERLLNTVPPPEGFVPTTDTAKKPNAILRYWSTKVVPGEGRPAPGSLREATVVRALEACERAALWLLENAPRLADTAGA